MKPLIQLFPVLVLAIFIFGCNQSTKDYIQPINPDATQKTKNLYYFIQDIQGTYSLSGQHNFVGKGSDYTDQLEEMTGLKAIIWGSDFSFCVDGENPMRHQHCGPANLPAIDIERFRRPRDSTQRMQPPTVEYLDITLAEARDSTIKVIKEKYAIGHIITLMWHGCYPTEGDCCDGTSIWAMENRPSPEEWDKLVTEGTELNDMWKEGADKIAGYLKELQDANIPVLWRPYHEMNGVWFWWCNHKGDQGFKRLWIMMYDYFTNHHKLNNLIWVWNTNAPRDIPGDEAWPYELFYPGTEYVDVLAADVYRNDYKQSHHDDLITLGGGKPIALGEVSNMPTEEILEQQPQWTWFMPWGWILFLSDSEIIKEMMSSEKVLTLDEIEVEKNGRYSVKTE
ncbi:MAG: glycosyl hydrolase family 26 [Mariniphaga sp.]|nr:glycosyl hydrolase family 26 [Mariniphaga sp.]